MVEIEVRNPGGGVRVDDDAKPSRIGFLRHADSRKTVPCAEIFGRQGLALGILDVDQMRLAVVGDQEHEHQRQRDRECPANHLASQVEPDGRRHGQNHGSRQHGIRTAEAVQQGQQQHAAHGRAHQVEEVDSVDALDGLRDGERNDGSAKEERQRAGEVDQGQSPVAEFARTREDKHQRAQHRDTVDGRQGAQLHEKIAAPRRNQVRENAPGPQPEQGDRNRQKREMVVKDDGKDARQRQFQN